MQGAALGVTVVPYLVGKPTVAENLQEVQEPSRACLPRECFLRASVYCRGGIRKHWREMSSSNEAQRHIDKLHILQKHNSSTDVAEPETPNCATCPAFFVLPSGKTLTFVSSVCCAGGRRIYAIPLSTLLAPTSSRLVPFHAESLPPFLPGLVIDTQIETSYLVTPTAYCAASTLPH